MVDKKNIGSALDEFLAEDNLLESCEEIAIKEILADQIIAAMQAQGVNKTTMAKRMNTSRKALDRLLDPTNTGVTLHTMQRAASAVGRRLTLRLT